MYLKTESDYILNCRNKDVIRNDGLYLENWKNGTESES